MPCGWGRSVGQTLTTEINGSVINCNVFPLKKFEESGKSSENKPGCIDNDLETNRSQILLRRENQLISLKTARSH